MDALQTPSFAFYGSSKPVVAVEGIYDKYAIELLLNISPEYDILPGTSANSIVKNIQFLNAFSKTHAAIWDNDDEGRKEKGQATKLYGEFEARKFDRLPLLGEKNRRMEKMFENSDLDMMRRSLGLPTQADYEKTLSSLRFADPAVKKRILGHVSSETSTRFELLREIIAKRIAEAGAQTDEVK